MNESERIAKYLAEARIGLLAHYLSFIFLGYPDHVEEFYQRLAGTLGEPIPLVVSRRDGSIHQTPSIGEILHAARELPGFGFGPDLFSFMMRAIAVKIGDELGTAGLIKRDVPLLQFVRHLRNASAHNNKWIFRPGQPKFPAAHRSNVLDSSMSGQSVFLQQISMGEFLDLLEDVRGYLLSLNPVIRN